MNNLTDSMIDPIALAKQLWPDVYFYDKQREIIYSVLENDETFVPAGNMLGSCSLSAILTVDNFVAVVEKTEREQNKEKTS